MTPGDAYWVGAARPRKPAILPLGPLIFNISLCLSALLSARLPSHHGRLRFGDSVIYLSSRRGRRSSRVGPIAVASVWGVQKAS